MRTSESVTIASTLACLALFMFGMLVAISPTFLDGGVIGMLQQHKYEAKKDILGILSLVWLIDAALSVVLGLAIALIAGLAAIFVGLGASVFHIQRARHAGRRKCDGTREAGSM